MQTPFEPLVSVIGGEPLASSLVIARGMRQQHASTMRLIRRYVSTLEQFGRVRFEIRLFNIADDYQVGEAACGYDAVGCGEDIAKGALHVSLRASPEGRIREALQAAEAHSAGVRGPFTVLSV